MNKTIFKTCGPICSWFLLLRKNRSLTNLESIKYLFKFFKNNNVPLIIRMKMLGGVLQNIFLILLQILSFWLCSLMRFQLITTINLEYQVLHVYVVQGWRKVLISLILEQVLGRVGVDLTWFHEIKWFVCFKKISWWCLSLLKIWPFQKNKIVLFIA
jgi:hypothetical protein